MRFTNSCVSLMKSMETNILLPDLFNSSSSSLSSEDLQRVELISTFYQNRIEFANRDGLPWNPSVHNQTFLQVLNSHSIAIMRLLSFFKQIPEFNQLNLDDKVTLIKSNILTVLGVNCSLLFNTNTNEIVETDSDVPWNTQFFQVLHGYEISNQSKRIFASFLYIAQYDRKIVQLTLIIIILTKNFSVNDDQNIFTLNDELSVFRLQNFYTELLWKYMESTHGYEKTIDLFMKFIVQINSWQILMEEMRKNILKTLSPEDISELLPIMKTVLRIS